MALLFTPSMLQEITYNPEISTEDIQQGFAFVQYMMAAYTLGVGLAYCFYGAKVFSYVHAAVCFLYSFMVLFLIAGGTTVALFIAAGLGGLIAYGCFFMKRFQAWILCFQIAMVLAFLSIVGLALIGVLTGGIATIIILTAIVGSIVYACTRPLNAMVECTAIVGAYNIVSASIEFAGSNILTISLLSPWAMLGAVAAIPVLAFAGFKVQRDVFGLHISDDDYKNAENRQGLLNTNTVV
jgi:hypothetical protein